jgi:glycerophosphoryl diester phosphodiesterase
MGRRVFSPGFVEENWPLVVAHRGDSIRHPENTLPAFEAAVAAGADAVELDVRLSADGVLVVSHDPDLERTAGTSANVCDLTVEQLGRLNVGRPEEPVRIPTLNEVLQRMAGRVRVDIEIKNIPGQPDFDTPREAVAEALVTLLDQLQGVAQGVVVTSFNWLSLERVQELAPDVPTGVVTNTAFDPASALAYASRKEHPWVLPEFPALAAAGEAFVTEAHAAGVRVGTWTVDDPDGVDRLFGWGVDAVVTNDSAMAVPIRERHRAGG